jgi:hypothetical protein
MLPFGMTALRQTRMGVDEFLSWAARQPERWELFDGIAVAMTAAKDLRDKLVGYFRVVSVCPKCEDSGSRAKRCQPGKKI